MTKEELEIINEIGIPSDLRRMKIVSLYLHKYGKVIEKGLVSPGAVMTSIGKQMNLPYASIYQILKNAGVYRDRNHAVIRGTKWDLVEK